MTGHLPGGTLGSMLKSLTTSLITTTLLILALNVPRSLNAAEAKGLGMWVWSDTSYRTEDARQRLVRFCLKHCIKHLDVHIGVTHDSGTPVLNHAAAFRELIALAGRHKITTAALRGHPKMFFQENIGPSL
jgi:hypothetical protein